MWTAFAIILESLPPLIFALFVGLDMFGLAPVRGRDPSVFLSGGEYLGVFVMVAAFGTWGLTSAIGLLTARRWARDATIVFAIVTTVVMTLYLVLTIHSIVLGHSPNSPWINACVIGIETFYIGVSVWSLVLLKRPRIVRELGGTPLSAGPN